ncbi:MAG: hypothetical protein US25_C0058G0004 [Candidatus Moranbacteria bacterium GW2011_GWE1_36_7]|nr:MAG: hypothetical protein UR99_C0048G0007 [Candidatus Moranbacteria bacterium GW2011_GWD2_36_12]KKQ04840.1 MAG: hypothetical protein US16_C0045G0007 [Candidatus Moranbacteria bacterium GW2011_GWE2_36_40]KKQ12260.1 MAG: hypothetical protein US25_C0058G0004 [Candidatus Moranbacteria bacterium GW2011_GWE1_36_7]
MLTQLAKKHAGDRDSRLMLIIRTNINMIHASCFLEFHVNIIFYELPVDPRDGGRVKNTYLHEIQQGA